MPTLQNFKGVVKRIWVPKPYQEAGVDWLSTRPSSALFWKPGLGKTTTVMRAFQKLRQMKKLGVKRMVVIAPLKVCEGVWAQQQEEWGGFEELRIGFAHGSAKREVLHDKNLDIVLLNYDGLLWAVPFMVPGLFDVVCFDELPRMKHTNTRRFKLMKSVLGSFKFRWGLTGTPIPNGLMDIFGQVFILDGGARLGPYITKFRLKYFHQKPFDKWSWFPNQGADKQIVKAIANLAHYVDEEQWNKLPKLINMRIKVDLPPDVMQQYKRLEQDFIVKLKSGIVTAATAATLSLKLRQFASGSLYDDERHVVPAHECKLDALESLYTELNGEPLIVAVGFLHEVEAIRKRLGTIDGKPIPYIGSGMAKGELALVQKRWNMGWLPIVLGHPTSMAYGLNLQGGGCNLAWYSLTFNAEEFEQLIRRLRRTGQKNKVVNYRLESAKTIDEYLWSVVGKKGMTQQKMLDALRDFYGVK